MCTQVCMFPGGNRRVTKEQQTVWVVSLPALLPACCCLGLTPGTVLQRTVQPAIVRTLCVCSLSSIVAGRHSLPGHIASLPEVYMCLCLSETGAQYRGRLDVGQQCGAQLLCLLQEGERAFGIPDGPGAEVCEGTRCQLDAADHAVHMTVSYVLQRLGGTRDMSL